MSGNGDDDTFYDDFFGMRQWLLQPDPDEEPFTRDMRRYLGLITGEHTRQWRFMRTVGLSVRPIADMLAVARRLCTLFDVDTAVGQQLDFVGQWAGISRRVTIAVEHDGFSWDIDALGWDDAEWWQPGWDDDHATAILDDEYYRLVIKAKIAANMWDGTRQGAYDAWHLYLEPLGYRMIIYDNYPRTIMWLSWDEPQMAGWWDNSYWDHADLSGAAPDFIGQCHGNMWMTLILVGPPPDAVMQALFSGGYLDLRPAGVGIGYLCAWSDDGSDGLPMFAWDEGEPGPEPPPVDVFAWDEGDPGPVPPTPISFSWDEPGGGWDESEWDMGIAIVAIAPLAGMNVNLVGWDEGLWYEHSMGGVTPADTVIEPLPLAGWDEGYWARELQPLALTGTTAMPLALAAE